MDFGVVSLEGLVGPESGVSSHQVVSDTEAIKPKNNGSGFLKQEGSESGEDEWGRSKMARPDGFDEPPKTMLHQQGTGLLRSNSLLSAALGGGGQHHNILSFSLPKSEVHFPSKNGGLVYRNTQNSVIPYYQHSPYSYSRNTGYGAGSSNAGMHGSFPGIRGPFTPSQWMELEHQALIYKYITANVPVPSNLLIALKKSINPFGLSGSPSYYAPNSFGWGSFHLGFSGNNDPEPGRCRRTDGKKWRCSRDAVPDQKYCERHINRGRHRSRKHVEGQTGHVVSGSTTSKVTPIASSTSASVVSSSSASNTLNVMQHQFNSLQPGATNPSTVALINRQNPQDLSMVSPAINLMPKGSGFSVQRHVPLDGFSQPEFGLVSHDTFLNPSQRSSYFNPRDYNSFVDFGDQKTRDQHSLRQFIDDWPKDQSNRITTAWPEELKSDWTQLSMSIPMTSNFSSTSSPTLQEKIAISPLRLSRELDPTEMGLGMSNDLSETFQKQTNGVLVSWGSSIGGPLGEVLNGTSGTGGACKNSSAMKLVNEAWDGNTQLGSSPTGVLQKTTFVSLSNSSSGSSPRADKKTNEYGSFCDDGLGSTLASSFSVPSL
ncbi:growth-regulating factor 1-like isoform X2 [Cornus florida]|uniref:growth-regulating factor 1-like isoform X2 n=1 Tax=Cornus florida TaxID=4283 RepID=UPI00289AAA06|nr:growth-regulating factor 1-like isoform X2 [Cornus florida]